MSKAYHKLVFLETPYTPSSICPSLVVFLTCFEKKTSRFMAGVFVFFGPGIRRSREGHTREAEETLWRFLESERIVSFKRWASSSLVTSHSPNYSDRKHDLGPQMVV